MEAQTRRTFPKTFRPFLPGFFCLAAALAAHAHDPSDPGARGTGPDWFLAQNTPGKTIPTPAPPPQAAIFGAFAPAVHVRWDERNLYVESNGIPAHPMMAGITAWQQQVPLPQPYTGTNAWSIPLRPVPARQPRSIHNQFLRGAIALAANGIPIFNPQNNRGEISAQIGELDRWGGHCGRADDYHYHAAPLHLEPVVGKGKPIAFALDGYPILSITEPNGSPPASLDPFHGHEHGTDGYHYHASLAYPYVNGGFHGEVVEREGQVDPQPRANPVRPSLQALRGAKITSHEPVGKDTHRLSYDLNGQPHSIVYSIHPDGTYPFEFHSPASPAVREVYSAHRPGQDRPEKTGRPPDRRRPGEPDRPGKREDTSAFLPDRPTPPNPSIPLPARTLQGFVLRSPGIPADGTLPAEFTGEGAGFSPPLEWSGAPPGTKSYALTMHHLDPEGRTKCYWILHHIPGDTVRLPKNSRSIGNLGLNSINRRPEYAPPHSKGPGLKSYTLTLHALSGTPDFSDAPVDLDTLHAAIRNQLLASTELPVHFTRSHDEPEDAQPGNSPRPQRPPTGRAHPPRIPPPR